MNRLGVKKVELVEDKTKMESKAAWMISVLGVNILSELDRYGKDLIGICSASGKRSVVAYDLDKERMKEIISEIGYDKR